MGGRAWAQASLLHQWTFNDAVHVGLDSVGQAHGSLFGGASRTTDGMLLLDGISGYFLSPTLGDTSIGSKSLVAWIAVTNLTQQGGSALTIGNNNQGQPAVC